MKRHGLSLILCGIYSFISVVGFLGSLWEPSWLILTPALPLLVPLERIWPVVEHWLWEYVGPMGLNVIFFPLTLAVLFTLGWVITNALSFARRLFPVSRPRDI